MKTTQNPTTLDGSVPSITDSTILQQELNRVRADLAATQERERGLSDMVTHAIQLLQRVAERDEDWDAHAEDMKRELAALTHSEPTASVATNRTYFMYDPKDMLLTYDTEEEARKAAERAMDEYESEAADDGWSEEVIELCWGVVIGEVHEISRKPSEDKRFDEIIEYRLIEGAPTASTCKPDLQIEPTAQPKRAEDHDRTCEHCGYEGMTLQGACWSCRKPPTAQPAVETACPKCHGKGEIQTTEWPALYSACPECRPISAMGAVYRPDADQPAVETQTDGELLDWWQDNGHEAVARYDSEGGTYWTIKYAGFGTDQGDTFRNAIASEGRA